MAVVTRYDCDDLLVITTEHVDRALELATIIADRADWRKPCGDEQLAILIAFEEQQREEVELLPPAYALASTFGSVPVVGYAH